MDLSAINEAYGLGEDYLQAGEVTAGTFEDVAQILYCAAGRGYGGFVSEAAGALRNMLVAHLGGSASAVAESLCLGAGATGLSQAERIYRGLLPSGEPTVESERIFALALYALSMPGYRVRVGTSSATWLVPGGPALPWGPAEASAVGAAEGASASKYRAFVGSTSGNVTPYAIARTASHLYGKGPLAAGLWAPRKSAGAADMSAGGALGRSPDLVPPAHPVGRLVGASTGPLSTTVFQALTNYMSESPGDAAVSDSMLARMVAALYAWDPSEAYGIGIGAGGPATGELHSSDGNYGAALEALYAYRLLTIPTARQILASALGFDLRPLGEP